MRRKQMARRPRRTPLAMLPTGRFIYGDEGLDFWGSLAVFLAALVMVGVVWLFLILLFSL